MRPVEVDRPCCRSGHCGHRIRRAPVRCAVGQLPPAVCEQV